MPHISPRQINQKLLKQLYEIFFSAITSQRISRKEHRIFFNELLTPTEKIMLGKRLTAVACFSRGMSAYQTGKLLKLSPTTTAKLYNKFEQGKCKHLIKVFKLQKKGELGYYLENLLRPLPRYGTSPSQLFREK